VQRARILAAMAHVVAEHGAGSVTVSRVVARAGVSRRTFYELFDGCEDCFLGVFEDAFAHASRVMSDAAASSAPPVWREQVRAGLSALLLFFDREPGLASVLVVDALAAGPDVLARRAQVLASLAAIVERGRSQSRGGRRRTPASPSSPPPLTAEGLVGAVLAVIHARMLERRDTPASRSANGSSRSRHTPPAPLIELLNPLMGMIVLPYLGQAAARRELDLSPPPSTTTATRSPKGNDAADVDADSRRSARRSSENPLEGLNMRLTYRTLQVLAAIAMAPGASNREVADHAGIHDQGQISKLLARLQRLGLIHNTGHGQPHGEPNAWTLTPRGRDIEQALTVGR
jgi:AcrR family transcriptional regulator/DNA-binding MarR family transcriptional regulator